VIPEASQRWLDAELALAAFAVAPAQLGGVVLRAAPGPVRDIWLELLQDYLASLPTRRLPLHVSEARLLGGIDLGATLTTGELQVEHGILHHCHGGVAILAMAERAERNTIAHLCSALDMGEITVARTGLNARVPSRLGVIALDEGINDEQVNPALADRLAFSIDLSEISIRDVCPNNLSQEQIAAARQHWSSISASDEQMEVIAATGLALGVQSPRAMLQTLDTARIFAALEGSSTIQQETLERAIMAVMVPRATQLPQFAEESEPSPPEDSEVPPGEQDASSDADNNNQNPEPPPIDQLIEAIAAQIPPGLLQQLQDRAKNRSRGSGGKAGKEQMNKRRGRPVGVIAGDLRRGERLNLIATLRAAAPWQPLRHRQTPPNRIGHQGRIVIRKQDFRITRFRHPQQSATIFVVDASGSAAMHRMAEAKGAVELLLADCYVRRDTVALIAFGGERADLLLPPTRSLVRAKRSLAALPGGGGTPLASAIDLTRQLSTKLNADGFTTTAVFLTDGVANVARDGRQGRSIAAADAEQAGRALAASGIRTLVIDSSPRAQARAKDLALHMGGEYITMPNADARAIKTSVASATMIGG